MTPQGPSKAPKAPRFSLPEEGKKLKEAWSAGKLLELMQQILQTGVQFFFPSTEDVLSFVQEAVLVGLEALGQEHWDTQMVNPEVKVGETETGVEGYQIAIDPSTGLPVVRHDPELGEFTPEVVSKPTKNQGAVITQTRRPRRTWLSAKEPTQLYDFLQSTLGLITIFDQKSPSCLKQMRQAADVLRNLLQQRPGEWAGSQSQGAGRSGQPRLGGNTLTIAGLANFARRQRRGKTRPGNLRSK